MGIWVILLTDKKGESVTKQVQFQAFLAATIFY